jgi:hypothetical protein
MKTRKKRSTLPKNSASAPETFLMKNIAIVNRSTLLGDEEVERALSDIQTQIHRDFFPVWGVDANLLFVGKNMRAPAETWQLVILDNSDQAGILGYHDLTPDGFPLGKVFARTESAYKTQWTTSASHELLEMLVDPCINLCAVVTQHGKTKFYAYECADACESDVYGYKIGATLVSDFVFPSWFERSSKLGTQFDFCGKIDGPFITLPGGFLQCFDVMAGDGWQQVENLMGGATPAYSSRASVGSRRERRRIGRDGWLKSADDNPGWPLPRTSGDVQPGRSLPRKEGDANVGRPLPRRGGDRQPGRPLPRKEGDANVGRPLPRTGGNVNVGRPLPRTGGDVNVGRRLPRTGGDVNAGEPLPPQEGN